MHQRIGDRKETIYNCRMPREISLVEIVFGIFAHRVLVSSLDSRAGDQHHEGCGGDRCSAHPPEAGKQRQCSTRGRV